MSPSFLFKTISFLPIIWFFVLYSLSCHTHKTRNMPQYYHYDELKRDLFFSLQSLLYYSCLHIQLARTSPLIQSPTFFFASFIPRHKFHTHYNIFLLAAFYPSHLRCISKSHSNKLNLNAARLIILQKRNWKRDGIMWRQRGTNEEEMENERKIEWGKKAVSFLSFSISFNNWKKEFL